MAALFERPPAELVLDGCEHGGIIIGAGVMQQRVFGLVYAMFRSRVNSDFETGCGPANLVSGGTVQSQTTFEQNRAAEPPHPDLSPWAHVSPRLARTIRRVRYLSLINQK